MSKNFQINLEENLIKAYPSEKLKKLFTALKNNVLELRAIIHHDFSSLQNSMENYYHHLQFTSEQTTKPASSGNSKCKSTRAGHYKKDFGRAYSDIKSNINRIINSLQFEDILSQKLSHIEKIQQAVIDELNHSSKAENLAACLHEKKYLPIVPEITRLHIGQLECIRGEYQTQTQNIVDDLIEIDKYSQGLSKINGASHLTLSEELKLTRQHIEGTPQFGDLMDEVIRQLSNLSQKIIVPPMQAHLKKERIKMIEGFYTVESEWVIHRKIFPTKGDAEKTPANDFDDTVEIF